MQSLQVILKFVFHSKIRSFLKGTLKMYFVSVIEERKRRFAFSVSSSALCFEVDKLRTLPDLPELMAKYDVFCNE